jgi:HTH-type transcriptional regulator/antitoxin HigA
MARAKSAKKARSAPGGDRYLELVRRFPLRPLRSDGDLDAAIAVVDALLDRDELDPGEEDYLDVLSDLVKRYETEAHPMPPVSDAEMLRYLIETRDTTQAAVSEATGIAESTVSEVLAGKRGLNRRHIESLARHFKVSPAVFMNP